jgi:hypothetical protein
VRFLLSLLFLLGIAPLRLCAQVEPTAAQPFHAYVYAAADGTEHELNYGHALGGSGGVVLQHSRWLALDLRGVVIRERVRLHTYAAEAGPRVYQRVGPIRVYAEGLGGLGHSGYTYAGQHPYRARYGAMWTGCAGLDLRLTRRVSWRVGEYSHNHIYAGTGAKAAILSTGVVVRLF